MKVRVSLIILFFLGLLVLTIVSHEYVHVFQFGDSHKKMCVDYGEGLKIYVRGNTNEVKYNLKGSFDKDEILANIVSVIIFGLGSLYFYKNLEAFEYEKD